MNNLLSYLLKVILCSALFFAYYLLALRNKNFHPYNRFYLMATAIFSVCLPFLHLSMFDFSSDNQNLLALMQVWGSGQLPDVVVTNDPPIISWQQLLLLGCVLTTVLLLFLQVRRIRKVYRLKKAFPNHHIDKVTFIYTDIKEAPFSFMKNLFWRQDIALDDAIGEQIYRHEMAHITQKHSWDKLFFQILRAVFWMNPVYYYMQRELLLIHEFIADEQAIENKDGAAFAQMLLRTQIGQFSFEPAHSLFYSSIKKRLYMITNSRKPKYSYLRRLLFLPLLFGVTFVFAFRAHKLEMAQQQKDLKSIIAMGRPTPEAQPGNGNDMHADTKDFIVTGYATKKDTTAPQSKAADTAKKVNLKLVKADEKPTPMVILNGDKQHPISFQEFRAIPADQVEAITVLKDQYATSAYGEKGKNGVMEVKMKTAGNAASFISSASHNTGGKSAATLIKTTDNRVNLNALPADKQPLYVLDGKPISATEMKSVNSGTINAITVLKDKSAVAIYGTRAANGVVLITTKTGKQGETDSASRSNPQEPSFPGGVTAWQHYLNTHLHMQTPVDHGAPPGTYHIVVSFLVSKTGEVSEVKAISKPDPDYGCAAEAERIVRESGKWNPAIKDGKPATYREKQKIIFQVSE